MMSIETHMKTDRKVGESMIFIVRNLAFVRLS